MARRGKTAEATAAEAKLHAAKALQFMEASRHAAANAQHDAAMLNAIHAAISATDAVTAVLARRRSSDPDHQRAAELLEQVAGDSSELKAHFRQLRELLAKKNVVEYESRRATAREGADAVRRAERFVEWAVRTVDRARVERRNAGR